MLKDMDLGEQKEIKMSDLIPACRQTGRN